MNKNQSNRLNMFKTVQSTLIQFQAAWQNNNAVNSAFQQLGLNITNIESAATVQERNTTGLALDKKNLRTDTTKAALILIGALRALAHDSNNQTLAKTIDFSESKLNQMNAAKYRDALNNIYKEAQSYKTPLTANYAITQARYDNYEQARAAYDDLDRAPEKARGQRMVNTSSLAKIFKETSTLLETKLDGLMLQYEDTEPNFFANYTNNRRIVDL